MRRFAAILALLPACSGASSAATSPDIADHAAEDAGAADAATCDRGQPLSGLLVIDCVVATDDGCPCGLAAYRCSTPGAFSLDTPLGAYAGPDGEVCSDESTCVRANRYDARCHAAGLGEAYSCPVLEDGGTPPLNILWAGTRLDGPAPEGEGPIVCGKP